MANRTFSIGTKSIFDMMGIDENSADTQQLIAANTINALHNVINLTRDPKVVSDHVMPALRKLGFEVEPVKVNADGTETSDVYRHDNNITVWTYIHTGNTGETEEPIVIRTVEDVQKHFAIACEKLAAKLQTTQDKAMVDAQISAFQSMPESVAPQMVYYALQANHALDRKQQEKEPTKLYLLVDNQVKNWGMRAIAKVTARDTAKKWVAEKSNTADKVTE